MQNTALGLVGFTIAMVVIAPVAKAEKGATDFLADQADAIVVGGIQSAQQAGTATTFVLAVTRSLKGPFDPGAVLTISGPDPDPEGSFGGQYGLWFLKQTGGQWSALPAEPSTMHPSRYLPMPKTSSPSSITTKSPPSTVHDRLALELAAALQAAPASSRSFSQLADALLQCRESALIPEIHRALHGHADPAVRFVGLAGLVHTSERIAALSEVAGNIEAIKKHPARRFVSSSLCGFHDPSGVASLARIAQSTGAFCAVQALAFIHTIDTLPTLADLLDHSDPAIRELAICGLSRFVNNFPITHVTNPR